LAKMKKEERERMKLNNKKIGMRRLTVSSEKLVGRRTSYSTQTRKRDRK